jgi:hypothetical protein
MRRGRLVTAVAATALVVGALALGAIVMLLVALVQRRP